MKVWRAPDDDQMTRITLNVAGRIVLVLGLAAWAIERFSASDAANGAWMSALALFVAATFLHRGAIERRKRRGVPPHVAEPLRTVALKAAAFSLLALALAVAKFTGIWIREDVGGGFAVLAASAIAGGVAVHAWLSALRSRVDGSRPEPRGSRSR